MTCPPKPWETACVNRRVDGIPGSSHTPDPSIGNSETQASRLQSTANSSVLGGGNMNRASPQVPPPVPPRPEQYSSAAASYPRYGYSNYGTTGLYNGMYGGMYGGGMGGYGYGGYGYNRFGYNTGYGTDYYGGNHEANFVRVAEESSRQAFQSIESIVQAFASVSMMLESTYHAVYSSFRAVLGVADHFSRLRVHLSQILSTLALIRTLRWLYRKIMYQLGFIKVNPSSEAAWSAATKSLTTAVEESDLKQSRASWPIMMFFGVVLGAPWLIWRLLSSLTGDQIAEKWPRGEADHYLAVAQYDFQGEAPRELTFTTGQQIILAPKGLQPKVKGWLLASVDGKKVGLVPANYLKILGFKRGTTTGELVQRPETANQVIATPSTSYENVAASENLPMTEQSNDSSGQQSDDASEEFVQLGYSDIEKQSDSPV